MRPLSVLSLLALLSLMQCTQDELTPRAETAEPFVFGSFFGFCQGESCIEIFKIEGEALFEDTKDQYPLAYPPEPYEGAFVRREAAAYELARHLPAEVPEALFDEEARILGIPDAGDWGGWYIARKHPTTEEVEWRIVDNNLDNVPPYLHPFVEEMRRVVIALSD